MKKEFLILITTVTSNTLCAGVLSLKELSVALESAIASKDSMEIEKMTYTEGMSDDDRVRYFKSIPLSYFTIPTFKIGFGEISPDQVRPFRIHRGLKVIPTAQPIGNILLYTKNDSSNSAAKIPYAKVNNHYYIVGVKSEKIDWDGPPDKQIGWGIIGYNFTMRDIKYTYNASGVMVTDSSKYTSSCFWGQYISEVRFTSENEKFKGEIIISEGGEVIERSEEFIGKGTFIYKRKE